MKYLRYPAAAARRIVNVCFNLSGYASTQTRYGISDLRRIRVHIGKLEPIVHFVFESLAYFVGFRLYLFLRKQDTLDMGQRVRIIASCVAGAAIGSKLINILSDPSTIASHFASLEALGSGKGIVGALVGGWIGIEMCKAVSGIKSSTGDSFVVPLVVGMSIGRIGCFLTGFYDRTYGIESSAPWAVDFGDGIRRHPTQLYEIGALIVILVFMRLAGRRLSAQGDKFKFFMCGYMIYRLLVDAIKPVPHPYLGLSVEQLVAILVLLFYCPFLISLLSPFAAAAGTRQHD